jgi:hypothetical protein
MKHGVTSSNSYVEAGAHNHCSRSQLFLATWWTDVCYCLCSELFSPNADNWVPVVGHAFTLFVRFGHSLANLFGQSVQISQFHELSWDKEFLHTVETEFLAYVIKFCSSQAALAHFSCQCKAAYLWVQLHLGRLHDFNFVSFVFHAFTCLMRGASPFCWFWYTAGICVMCAVRFPLLHCLRSISCYILECVSLG